MKKYITKCSCNGKLDAINGCPLHYRLNLDNFGDYRVGLTNEEIDKYLKARCSFHNKKIKNISKLFGKVAGCNTVGVGPQGQSLMYRYDVLRFADKIFLGKETYFD